MPDLRAWIRDHEVCWERSPLWELAQHAGRPSGKVQVGFEVCLLARLSPHSPPAAGRPVGGTVYQGLAAVALAVLPEARRCAQCEIGPYDGASRARPESAWEPEVQLVVRVIHRRDYFRPVDECETRCVDEIERGLRELGARPKAWRKVA